MLFYVNPNRAAQRRDLVSAMLRFGDSIGWRKRRHQTLTGYSMGTSKLTIFLASLAVVTLVAVLALLIIESGAVRDEYFVAHAERIRSVESALTDVGLIRDGAANALEQAQPAPQFFDPALARLDESNRVLSDLSDMPRITPEVRASLDTLDAALRQFVADGRAFAAQQGELASSLQTSQQDAAEFVRQLREQGFESRSQAVFALAVEVFEFAAGRSADDADGLLRRIRELQNDVATDDLADERLSAFALAATEIVERRSAAVAAAQPIAESPVAADLAALEQALIDVNRTTVNRSERARLLLALSAIVLLIAAAYAVYRLQSSYRELNRANAELEDRVTARTEQLSRAFEDLKESQVQLIHAEKMSSLGEMVAGISHEINTPLWYLMNNTSVIQERIDVVSQLCDIAESMLVAVRAKAAVNETVGRGLVQMDRLLKEGIKDDIDEAKSLIQDSIDGLDDLTALAQGLKDFSRLDRAQKGEFDVNEGLDRSLLIAKNRIKYKATVHKHYGDVPSIYCSPSQINQIFLNLLTNAADAIEKDGDIVVETRETDGAVEIEISDSGCGIAEDVLPKVRDPFFTTKQTGKGTGLGLSIVDRIVAEHGGELRIDSHVGVGTTVTVSLPVGKQQVQDIDVGQLVHGQPTPDPEIDTAVLSQKQGAATEKQGSALSA